jgi:hypothetical protein
MKKEVLRKQLSLYTMASGALALVANNAQAQAVYTDITPDATITTFGSSYIIDLNNDAADDFKFELEDWGSGTGPLYIKPLQVGHGVAGVADAGFTYKTGKFDAGAVMGTTPASSNLWVASAMMAVKNGSNYGPFTNATDKYIGLRLKSGSDYYYGWVRVSVNIGTPNIVIKDMAYNSTANTAFETGAITTSTQAGLELDEKTIIFVNEANEVSVTNNYGKNISVELVSVNGNVIATKEILSGSTDLFASDQNASEVLIVRVKAGEAILAKKVFVK